MSWSSPRAWAVGELVTASNMNTYISDNLNYLYSKVAAQIELFGSSLWPSNTTGATGVTKYEMATNKEYFAAMSFVNGSQTYAEGEIPALPDDYNSGTMTAKFIWDCSNASTNSATWGIAGIAYGDNVALDAAFGTAQEVTDGNNGSYKRNISAASAAITFAGTPTAGKSLHLRVYRKGSGSDTLAFPALLVGVILNYTRT